MTPNEMKLKRQAVILKIAEDMGWTAVVELNGFDFEAYFTAEGACEQFVEGKLSQAEAILDDLGGPGLYPAVEEYDLSTEADNELTDEIAEEYLAAGEAEVIDVSEAMCEECSLSEAEDCLKEPPAPHDADPTNGLHEDVHDGMERGPKEFWQAAQVKNQDRGGIPRPNQYKETKMSVEFNGSEYVAPEGHHIEARKSGFETRQYGRQVNEAEKKRMVVDHWFFYAVKNSKAKETLLAGGTITVKSHRFVASEGRRIVARKGTMYFEALSLSTSYQKSGWMLSVTQ